MLATITDRSIRRPVKYCLGQASVRVKLYFRIAESFDKERTSGWPRHAAIILARWLTCAGAGPNWFEVILARDDISYWCIVLRSRLTRLDRGMKVANCWPAAM